VVSNVAWHHASVTRERREKQNGHKSCVIWFTGLSGAGKSTVAHAVEEHLYQLGCRTFVLDGDNVRFGLSSDLGFSKEDRKENIRRIGEVAKLMMEAGVITMTAFISPFRADREIVRMMMPDGDFFEVYCKAEIEICEARDVKGFYKKARAGEIKDYTGIDSIYEPPERPDILINTGEDSLEYCVNQVVNFISTKILIKYKKE